MFIICLENILHSFLSSLFSFSPLPPNDLSRAWHFPNFYSEPKGKIILNIFIIVERKVEMCTMLSNTTDLILTFWEINRFFNVVTLMFQLKLQPYKIIKNRFLVNVFWTLAGPWDQEPLILRAEKMAFRSFLLLLIFSMGSWGTKQDDPYILSLL